MARIGMLAILLMLFSISNYVNAEEYYESKEIMAMGTTTCSDTKFKCDEIEAESANIIAAADQCTRTDFMIPQEESGILHLEGSFKNCVTTKVPSSTERKSLGVKGIEWTSCCLHQIGSTNTCTMTCRRYMKTYFDNTRTP